MGRKNSPYSVGDGFRCDGDGGWLLFRPPFFFFSGELVASRVRVSMEEEFKYSSSFDLDCLFGPVLPNLHHLIWLIWEANESRPIECTWIVRSHLKKKTYIGRSCTREWIPTVGLDSTWIAWVASYVEHIYACMPRGLRWLAVLLTWSLIWLFFYFCTFTSIF